jgi:dihydropteroate synthase
MPTACLAGFPQPARAQVMGVLNVTPDSFSDGGRWYEPGNAISHGLEMLKEGADLIDVGGESTRPGIARTDEDEELRRVIPVVQELVAGGAVVSVDTMRASVARASIEVGARLINDVSGGLADPAMLPTIAEHNVAYICMHWRGHSRTMDQHADYSDVVTEVVDELKTRVDSAVKAGIAPERLVIDPGLGFAKTRQQDWLLLAHLDQVTALGLPVLVGASRKRLLGELLADAETGEFRSPGERDDAGVAVATLAAHAGVWCIRSHVVRPVVDAVLVAARWERAARQGTQ